MKQHHLPCPVVRDLLPSYIEGLTEDETTQLVKEHLDDCADCAGHYASMKGPELVHTEEQEEQKKVDYLKTIRRRNWKHIVLAVVLVCVLVFSGIAAKLFLIGSPLNLEEVFYTISSPNGSDQLSIDLSLVNSGVAFGHVDAKEVNGTYEITARKVLNSRAIPGSSGANLSLPLEGIHTVTFMGQTIWQEHLPIDQKTSAMYTARVPYVGSPTSLLTLAHTMDLPKVPFTNELQTATEPYGWTILFESPLRDREQKQMQRIAPLFLALVDNLGSISWTCPDVDGGAPVEHTVTLEEVDSQLEALVQQYNEYHDTNWAALDSVKDYAENVYTFQQLVLLLGA